MSQISAEQIKATFLDCQDVKMITYSSDVQETLVLYTEGMVDEFIIQTRILSQLDQEYARHDFELLEFVHSLPFVRYEDVPNLLETGKKLFTGCLILYAPTAGLYFFSIPNIPNRQPEESAMEVTVKGARDSLTEDVTMNTALIRKRLRTPSLRCLHYTIGTDSQTKVNLLYMEKIESPILEEVKTRLSSIDVDVLTTSIVEESLASSPHSIMHTVDVTSRPDYAVSNLQRGRFCVLIDGSPIAVLGPAGLFLLLKSPEDDYLPYFYVSFERFLRIFGLMMAILAPAFWVSLISYHPDQLPLKLLATVSVSRTGIPIPPIVESLVMQLLFELFREAGVRLPSAVGQTVAVVGGLFVGDAAIRAGLTSPSMLVVTATSAVATFTLINQSLSGTVILLRFVSLFLSSFLGLYGFFLSVFGILLYLSSLESYGLPFLYPFAPIEPKLMFDSAFVRPWTVKNKKQRRGAS